MADGLAPEAGRYQDEITPIGPDIDVGAPHDRAQLSSKEPIPQT
jgi:hypothetical protein